MQNIHGKEIDLLRTTVKVPGKRLPRAAPATAPGTSPRANGLALERSNTQLGGGTGEADAEVGGVWQALPPFLEERGVLRATWAMGFASSGMGPWNSRHAYHPPSCCRSSSVKCIYENASLMESELAAEV